LGKVSDVATLYQNASILVLSTKVEGFPNTLIEAMSFGLPSICFLDIPYEDIITDNVDDELMVKIRTSNSLAESIGLLIEKVNFRNELGSNAKNKVKQFDKRIITNKILDFMDVINFEKRDA